MHQYSQGIHTSQGHKGIPEKHYEEEQGRKGFFGPVSHLIKPEPSSRWVNIEGPLKPHLYDIVEVAKNHGKWQRLMFNSDVAIYNFWLKPDGPETRRSTRNADGDTLYFVHQGKGVVLTEYGLLSYSRGSYVCIPKSLHHTFFPEEETQFLVIESLNSFYREPERGMVGRNAFYDPASFGKPDLERLHQFKKDKGVKILSIDIKRLDAVTTFTYEGDVYDTVGWKGDYFPFTLHINDLMPMMSHRVHLPPSTHTTFVANGFVVCTFMPRPVESDPDALKVPFYHQNIDYDEVLFYHDGNFFSREGLHSGMITLHPAGFPHGPHPKAHESIKTKTFLDEVAVMVDSWKPFQVDPIAAGVEVPEYWKSWMKK
ncbi:MAG: homogentisate 1,2-dioxygenase [Bdellovibrionaceae bacterium]|nr:homogentisate 1,2-dioxygenase [Pseudobdellovibrionaceae bacterium]MBX3032637.1 homogentisate 1,2-dioxygenase [Pseudobdellovibrionaceae bacterium]